MDRQLPLEVGCLPCAVGKQPVCTHDQLWKKMDIKTTMMMMVLRLLNSGDNIQLLQTDLSGGQDSTDCFMDILQHARRGCTIPRAISHKSNPTQP